MSDTRSSDGPRGRTDRRTGQGARVRSRLEASLETTAFDRWIEQIPAIELSDLRRDEPPWINLPNAITFLRALLVPVILLLLATPTVTAAWWAFGIFVFAAATDSIDGWVARRMHGVTRWGQLADPIADKLLIIGSLASLAIFDRLPWWAVIFIMVREAAVTALRVRLVRTLDLVMPASRWGKAKTVSQIVAIGAFLLPAVSREPAMALLYIAVALTLLSGMEYGFRAGRLAQRTSRSAA